MFIAAMPNRYSSNSRQKSYEQLAAKYEESEDRVQRSLKAMTWMRLEAIRIKLNYDSIFKVNSMQTALKSEEREACVPGLQALSLIMDFKPLQSEWHRPSSMGGKWQL